MARSFSRTRNNNRRTRSRHKASTRRVYSKREYNSGDGMLTTVWGPAMWHFLHTMSFNYPVHPTAEQKRQYRDFVYQLRHVLPCKYCRINLTNNLQKKPLQMKHLANRDAFSRFVYELHELVNKMLGKTSNLTYADVRDRYEHFRSRCTLEKPKVFVFTRRVKKEKGCTEPMYGKKAKCVINIVPQEDKSATFQMDDQCVKSRGPDANPPTKDTDTNKDKGT